MIEILGILAFFALYKLKLDMDGLREAKLL